MFLQKALADPTRYRRQLAHLGQKHKKSGRLHELRQRDVPLSRLVVDAERFAGELARAVSTGTYQLSPAEVRRARLDKERLLFAFTAADLVVHGVVAEILTEAMEPHLAPSLHSYRKNRSSWRAARDFAAYVRAHRAGRPDPRDRGLYVLRCDVAEYGDSIPLAGWSPIWPALAEVLGLLPEHRDADPGWRLVQAVVRPLVHNPDEAPRCPCVGVPTGSPVATALANLYLAPLDHRLQAVDGGFYARYGDDLLFAHPDPAVVAAAERDLQKILAERGLRINEQKFQRLYMNGAGRPAPGARSGRAAGPTRVSDAVPDAGRGTTAVTYLGCRIDFAGTVGLSADKHKKLLGDLSRRIRQSAALIRDTLGEPGDEPGAAERARVLCAAVNAALDPASRLAVPYAALLAGAVTDRRQLKELDYRIARAVAHAVTGIPGARAFRTLSWRSLRRDFALVSLVARRNRGRS